MWIQNQSLVDKAMCVGSVYVCCEYAWGGGITIFYAPINSTPTPWEVVYHVLSCSVVSDSLRPMDCSLPDSSVHGILQLKILEWVAIRFSRNLDSILTSRDITLPTKVRLGKAMVFPVVMYGCESWTIRRAEHRRIDAFALYCWIESW